MMLIHLVGGFAVVVAAVVAAIAFALGWPMQRVTTIAGWALGLLIVQAASGMLLLTATDGGPGPVHIGVALIGLALVGGARLARPEPASADAPLLGAVFALVAIGALVALASGLAAG